MRGYLRRSLLEGCPWGRHEAKKVCQIEKSKNNGLRWVARVLSQPTYALLIRLLWVWRDWGDLDWSQLSAYVNVNLGVESLHQIVRNYFMNEGTQWQWCVWSWYVAEYEICVWMCVYVCGCAACPGFWSGQSVAVPMWFWLKVSNNDLMPANDEHDEMTLNLKLSATGLPDPMHRSASLSGPQATEKWPYYTQFVFKGRL